MIDHTSISVTNYDAARNFYDATLKCLGYERLINFETDEYKVAGYGADKPAFWISVSFTDWQKDETVGKAKGVHMAFIAHSAEEVDNWYKKCLELGAKDNGAPGPRAEYHSGYYGAFVVDPDGWRIEAVFHGYKE